MSWSDTWRRLDSGVSSLVCGLIMPFQIQARSAIRGGKVIDGKGGHQGAGSGADAEGGGVTGMWDLDKMA